MSRSILSGVGISICLAILLGAPPTAFAADDPIAVVARYDPTTGREAEAEARLLQVLAYLRKVEPGINFHLHRSTSEPTSFVWYEIYPSQAAFDQHMKVTLPAFIKEYGPPAQGLWAHPPKIETFRELAR